MSTKLTLSCMSLVGVLIPLSLVVYSATRSILSLVVAIISSIGVMGLLFYASIREKAQGDQSMMVSRAMSAMILCLIAAWVVFVFYREWSG